MRVKRHKASKRAMALYQHAFGFRQPYQVLCDGTFIAAAQKCKMNINDYVATVLLGPCKAMTTPCVITELAQLGPDMVRARQVAARDLQKRVCLHAKAPDADHEEMDEDEEDEDEMNEDKTGRSPTPTQQKKKKKKHHSYHVAATQCVLDMVGHTNTHRFIVCTQDPQLRARLREVPGVPLVYLNKSVVILEPPSDASVKAKSSTESTKFVVGDAEKQMLTDAALRKQARRRAHRQQLDANLATEMVVDPRAGRDDTNTVEAAEEEEEEDKGIPEATTSPLHQIVQDVASEQAKKKADARKEKALRQAKLEKRMRSEPNPLSQKKKKDLNAARGAPKQTKGGPDTQLQAKKDRKREQQRAKRQAKNENE